MICDAYILEDQTTAISILGVTDLLSMRQRALQNITTKGIPKSLRAFWNKGWNITTKTVFVTAENSHFRGRSVEVFDSTTIENLIRAYAFSFASDKLRENQKHIGKRCVFLIGALAKTAIDTAIKEACGLEVEVQKTAQQNYANAVGLLHEFGLKCSVNDDIATKKDIMEFLKVPPGTLNSFLYKHSSEIKPIKLDYAAIRAAGCKARRMNGYHIKDVTKIAFGMDTAIGIELKQRMFGEIGTLSKLHSKDEIQWRKIFSKVFSGYDLRFNHSIGSHRLRVDFFVAELLLCMECNGYSHRNYNAEWEAQREKIITKKYALIRFHRETPLECIFNAILQSKPGKVVRLYSDDQVSLTKFLSHN